MKNKKIIRIMARLLFVLYLIFLLFLVFGVDRMESSDYRYNLVLFSEIKRFVNYRDIVGYHVFLANVVGNFVVFMPFGFLLPILSKHKFNFILITLLSFELSLGIEVVQLFTRLGSFDVDDLLLNTLGGSAGYICFAICMWLRKKLRKKSKRKAGERR